MKKWSIVVVLSVVVLAANLACADPLYPSDPTNGDLPEAPYGGEAPNSNVGNSIRSEGVEAGEFIHSDGFAGDEGIEVEGIIEAEPFEAGDSEDSSLSDAPETDATINEGPEIPAVPEGDEAPEGGEAAGIDDSIKSEGVEAAEFIHNEDNEPEASEPEASEHDETNVFVYSEGDIPEAPEGGGASEVDDSIKSEGVEAGEFIHGDGDEGEVPYGGEAPTASNNTIRSEGVSSDEFVHSDGFEGDEGVEVEGIIEAEPFEAGDSEDFTLSDAPETDATINEGPEIPAVPEGGEAPEVDDNSIRSEGVESDEFVE